MRVTKREIIELGLTIKEQDDDYIMLEGDMDRSECSECTERMGLPNDAEEFDVCKACPVMRKMKPEILALLKEAGL